MYTSNIYIFCMLYDKVILPSVLVQMSLYLLTFFLPNVFSRQHSEICPAWRTTPTITGATVAPAWQTKGLRKKRLCWQQQRECFRSASPPRQAYNRLVSPLAGKGAGVLVGGFFLFGTFLSGRTERKSTYANVNGMFTRKMGKRDIFSRNVDSLFQRHEKEWIDERVLGTIPALFPILFLCAAVYCRRP